MAKGVLFVACVALVAVCVVAEPVEKLTEQLKNLNGKRDLKLLGGFEGFGGILGILRARLEDPNGFEIGAGISLDAEVDDIEAGLQLGPFKFELDDKVVEEEEEEEAEEKTPKNCNLQCDTLHGQTCCLKANGECPLSGNACPGIQPTGFQPTGFPTTGGLSFAG